MKKTKLSPETLEKLKRYASVALVSAGVVSFVAAMLFFSAYPDAPFPDYWKKLFTYVQYVLLSICTIPIGCIFVFFTMKAVESTTLRTAAHRLGLTINQRMLLKNAAYINPTLLEFLYAVLRANNETLHPMGTALWHGPVAFSTAISSFCRKPRRWTNALFIRLSRNTFGQSLATTALPD